jgi:hypothetical protein
MMSCVGRGRVLSGVAVALASGLVLRLMTGAGHGADATGHYALINPGLAYPCAPIHYAISSEELPDDFLEVVNGAVGKASAASGYRFFFDGMTGDRHFFNGREAGPVLIGFAATDEDVGLAGEVIGRGGSSWNTATGRLVTGAIQLDATQYRDVHDLAHRRAIVMHELGHVLGLDHVDDRGELMYPSTGRTTEYGPGDIAGLRHQYELSCPSS